MSIERKEEAPAHPCGSEMVPRRGDAGDDHCPHTTDKVCLS